MAKFTELLQKERKIRKTLLTPEGNPINIFEPNAKEANILLKIMENLDPKKMSEIEMMKQVYPIITDLDFEGCTDEMLEKVVEDGVLSLEEMNEEIILIFSELNLLSIAKEKTRMTNIRASLMEADVVKIAIDTLNDSDKLMKQAIDIEREARFKKKKEKAERLYVRSKQEQNQETSNEESSESSERSNTGHIDSNS